MAREKDGYRENLEILNRRFPEHEMLSIEQVMEVTGYRSRNTVLKHFGKQIVNNRLSKVYLARYMCG